LARTCSQSQRRRRRGEPGRRLLGLRRRGPPASPPPPPPPPHPVVSPGPKNGRQAVSRKVGTGAAATPTPTMNEPGRRKINNKLRHLTVGRCSGRGGGGGRGGGPGDAALAGVRFRILMAPPLADPSSFACPRDRVGWVVPLAGGCSLLSLSLCRCQVPTRLTGLAPLDLL
jgi:hypothetical protein